MLTVILTISGVYAILTVILLHYHHIGTCTYCISQQTRNPVSASIEETHIIQITWAPLPFWAPSGIAGAADG